MLPDPQNKQNSLKDCILAKIETEELCVRPRYVFWLRESLIWLLWLLVIFLGALALAVSSFVLVSRHFSLYEATHENFLVFLIEVVPVLWLLVFAVMIAVAIFNLRQTKRGYRYSVLTLGGSSLFIGLLFGIGLHNLGTGFAVDRWLGEQVDDYSSQDKVELKLWQQPTEGRLVGVLKSVEGTRPQLVMFHDVTGKDWQTNVVELHEDDWKLLSNHKRVRMVGLVTKEDSQHFHACGVLPWLYDSSSPSPSLAVADRQVRERLYIQHKKRPRNTDAGLANEETDVVLAERHCEHMPWFPRLEKSLLHP